MSANGSEKKNDDLIITEGTKQFTATQFICHALASAGVTHIFGGHGGAIVPLVDAIVAHPSLTWVYCRCEVNASQAAAAYAKLHGKVGCCVATSGPGAAHLLSGLVDADQDRVPLICLTGLKERNHGRYADFQDIDQSAIFRMAGLALSETVSDIDQLLPLMRNAFTIAMAANRCAHLAIPINVQQETVVARTHFCLGTAFQARICIPATRLQVDALALALRSEIEANRHVLIACGYRANIAGVGKYVERIAELLRSPILTSFDGKGTVDEQHPMSYGVIGMYGNAGTPSALDLMECCDTVIGICVNDWTELVANKSGLQIRRMIQIDERLVAGDSVRFAPFAVFACGYLGDSLRRVVKILEEQLARSKPHHKRLATTSDSSATLHPESAGDVWAELRKGGPFVKPTGTPATFLAGRCFATSSSITNQNYCHPAVFFKVMGTYLDRDSVICADIGDNALWMASSLAAKRGQRFITSEHLGIMGFGLNSGLAASLAAVDKVKKAGAGGTPPKTLVVAGDGGIQMSINELATMKDHGAVNVLVVVVVNGRLGRVQNETWGPGTNADGCHLGSPDYLQLFKAYGYPEGLALSTCDENVIAATIEKGWKSAAKHGCCVIELHQDEKEHPIMHKLQVCPLASSRTPWAVGEESLFPKITTDHWKHCHSQIQDWVNNLNKVEVSNAYWLDGGGSVFAASPSSIVQKLLNSFRISGQPQLFPTVEACSTFDSEFQASFLNALPAKDLLEDVLQKGTSNAHPLKIQFLACPPRFNFKLHAHPNVELCFTLVGELWERRLIGANLNPSVLVRSSKFPLIRNEQSEKFYESPSDEEMSHVKKELQATLAEKVQSLGEKGKFIDRATTEGRVMYNEAGSIHQSYTKASGCLLLVLWSGLHADIESCDCKGIDGSENLFLP